MDTLSLDSSILIIGAGTFGISTAYHLANRGYKNITCLDRHHWPSLDSAAYDLNKIIRTEYDDPLYTELALKALDQWRTPEWEGIYHETVRIACVSAGEDSPEYRYFRQPYDNLRNAGQGSKVQFIKGKQDLVKHCPQLEPAQGIDDWKGLWNGEGGWAHSKKALEHWSRAYEVEQWRDIPVIDNGELGYTFEPDPETGWMKVCNEFPGYHCKASRTDSASGGMVTYHVPRYASDYPDDKIPQEAVEGIRRFIDAVIPQFSSRPLVGARLCWCADSPDAHWLIDQHPDYPALLLATGDSVHAFKMFPIIGDYIADALEGKDRGLRPEWKYGVRQEVIDVTRPNAEVKDLRDVFDHLQQPTTL